MEGLKVESRGPGFGGRESRNGSRLWDLAVRRKWVSGVEITGVPANVFGSSWGAELEPGQRFDSVGPESAPSWGARDNRIPGSRPEGRGSTVSDLDWVSNLNQVKTSREFISESCEDVEMTRPIETYWHGPWHEHVNTLARQYTLPLALSWHQSKKAQRWLCRWPSIRTALSKPELPISDALPSTLCSTHVREIIVESWQGAVQSPLCASERGRRFSGIPPSSQADIPLLFRHSNCEEKMLKGRVVKRKVDIQKVKWSG
eukprot:2922352-Rhodomonas_salina.1